mmetsp:Transcript_19118/g.41403  ORF Transcript_19118/g.41403 Transcript_19118/m.41403 type:complete len:230 (+) Transcript_19118:206-895(+)
MPRQRSHHRTHPHIPNTHHSIGITANHKRLRSMPHQSSNTSSLRRIFTNASLAQLSSAGASGDVHVPYFENAIDSAGGTPVCRAGGGGWTESHSLDGSCFLRVIIVHSIIVVVVRSGSFWCFFKVRQFRQHLLSRNVHNIGISILTTTYGKLAILSSPNSQTRQSCPYTPISTTVTTAIHQSKHMPTHPRLGSPNATSPILSNTHYPFTIRCKRPSCHSSLVSYKYLQT